MKVSLFNATKLNTVTKGQDFVVNQYISGYNPIEHINKVTKGA